ncbi:MAG: YihY/virulence factor BrkB family protein, partial [Nocardioidaceae bacterium]
SPTDIPAKGWVQITKRSLKEVGNDHLTLIAKGVAFSWFMAVFPGLIAAISIYGLVQSPADVRSQVANLASALPSDAKSLITHQLQSLTTASGGALSISLIISVALALWSASAGMAGLLEALNIAYDEDEERSFVIKRGLAVLLTIGFLVFIAVAIALIGVFPLVTSLLGDRVFVRILLEIARWLFLLVAAIVALGLLYRVGPDRDAAAVKWLSLGSIVAAVIWVVASVGFSIYVDAFGSYAKTYGALAGVVVLLLWFWITALVVLLGAEINAETEAQTIKDTTKGPEKPLGQRDAVKADEVPPAQS